MHTSSGFNLSSRTLLATPTGHSPATKNALTKASLGALPRSHTFAEFKHRLSTIPRRQVTADPLITSQQDHALLANSTPYVSSTVGPQGDMMVVHEGPEQVGIEKDVSVQALDSTAEDPVTKVNICHISCPDLKDPMRCCLRAFIAMAAAIPWICIELQILSTQHNRLLPGIWI
jgi:hypothetical protein